MSVRTIVHFRCRLSGDKRDYRLLNEMSGAYRYLYNQALNHLLKQYQESINDTRKTGKCDYSYQDLGKWYTQHKKEEAIWLSRYSPAKPN